MSEAKLPAFQFYTGDWLKDPGLRSVSLAARGLWADMLSLMSESEDRGYLRHPNGKPVRDEQIFRMVGATPDEVTKALAELSDAEVFSRAGDGAIYSRRMVRDEEKRKKCQVAGKKGGNPALINPTLKGDPKGGSNRMPTPSSSSSSSTSVEETAAVPPVGAVAGNDQASADRGPAPRIAQPVKPRTRGTSARADSGASAPRPKPDDQRVIDAYCEGFKAVHDGRKPAVTGRCRKEIRGMLAEGLDVEDVIAAIPAYLAIEHGWVAENGWPLHAFPREWNRLATVRSAGTAVAVRSALPDRARLSRSGQVAVNALERTFARIDAEAAELKGGKP